jgi:hypothetical protein
MTYMNNQDPNDPLAEGVPGGPDATPGDESTDSMGDGSSAFMSGEDKKPANKGMVVLLGLVLVGGGGYFYMKQSPQVAEAGPSQTDDTVTKFLDSGEQHVQMMKQMLNNSEKVVQRFRTYPEKTQVPLAGLRANPFRSKAAGSDDPNKPYDPKASKGETEVAERRAAATDAAKKLRLQSIFSSGTTKACLLNGKLYRLGQEVDGFKIEDIDPKHIIVTTLDGEFKFELFIQR